MKIGKDYKIVASKILDCTLASYYNWDNQNRPIIKLLEKYFSKKDLEEFIEFGNITRLDKFDKYIKEKNKIVDKYLEYFNNEYKSFIDYNDEIIDIFIKTLVDYDDKNSFFIQFHSNILKVKDNYLQNKISFVLKDMIEKNIINILEEIIDILVTTDFKIIIERAWLENNKKRNEATIQYLLFNIYKYKKELAQKEKLKLFVDLYKFYELEYQNANFHSENPDKIYQSIEKIKN